MVAEFLQRVFMAKARAFLPRGAAPPLVLCRRRSFRIPEPGGWLGLPSPFSPQSFSSHSLEVISMGIGLRFLPARACGVLVALAAAIGGDAAGPAEQPASP